MGMRKLSNSDCDEMKDYDFARITAINEDYYGREKVGGRSIPVKGVEQRL